MKSKCVGLLLVLMLVLSMVFGTVANASTIQNPSGVTSISITTTDGGITLDDVDPWH